MNTWNNPPVETIYLADGSTRETEVNGKSLDGLQGWVFIDGCDIKVVLSHDGEWREVKQQEEVSEEEVIRLS